MEARLADAEAQSEELLGHSEDLLAICGSRMYVFFLDAAPTERLVSQEGSLLTFLQCPARAPTDRGPPLRGQLALAGAPFVLVGRKTALGRWGALEYQ
eukprot:1510919-Prymnesium_polylepis.1